MSGEDRYIPGVPCWIDTTQPDPAAAAEFYGELFGWEFEDRMPPGAPLSYHVAQHRRAATSPRRRVTPAEAPPGVEHVRLGGGRRRHGEQGPAAGGTVLDEPRALGEEGRMAVFADPAGAPFRAWEPGRHRGATRVNEHGSLNFNVLATRATPTARSRSTARCSAGRSSMSAARRCGRSQATATTLEQRTPGTA